MVKKSREDWIRDLKPYLKVIAENGGKMYEKAIKKHERFKNIPDSTIYFFLNDIAKRRYNLIETKRVGEGGELGSMKLWVLTEEGKNIIVKEEKK